MDRLPPRLRPLAEPARRAAPTVAFLAGFTWDSLTLRRIDQVFDNLLLLLYLLTLALLVVLERRIAHERPVWGWVARRREWLHLGAQFLYGGLLSAYVVFYWKSASLGRALLFVLLLAVVMVVNEFLDEHLRGEPVRLGLFAFCAFSLLLFFVPVMTGWPGPGLMLVAAAGAVLLTTAMALGIHGLDRPRLLGAAGLAGAVAVLLFLLDLLRLIPPVPLAVVEAGLFHDVARVEEGYRVTYERPAWYRPFADDDSLFRHRPGDRAWCFTAVFAPRGMKTRIWHRWERHDEEEGDWLESDRIPFTIVGGRDNGYRGYTAKRNVSPGEWRVRIETEGEREIGRVYFRVEAGEGEPVWEDRVVESQARMTAVLVFGVTYLLIAGRRWKVLPIGRPAGALLGAVATVALGVLSPDEAFHAVDLRTVGLLLGMMLVGAHLDLDGALGRIEDALAGRARTGMGVLVRLSLVAGLASALLVNDTVCVLLTPLVVRMCLRRGLPLAPFLLVLATSSNLGSAATLVGNPQNMLIASMSGLSYGAFLLRAGPAVALAFLAHLLLARLVFGRALAQPTLAQKVEPSPPSVRAPTLSIWVLLAVSAGFLAGLDLTWTSLAGGAALIIARRRDPAQAFARVDWTLLLFFAGLFVVVGGIDHAGLLARAFPVLAPHFSLDSPLSHLTFSAAVVAGSNLVSNVPLVMLAGPYVESMGGGALAWTELAYVSTVAGNLALPGSVANLIVAELAREHHEIGFFEYLRFGALATVSSLAVGVPALVAMHGLLP